MRSWEEAGETISGHDGGTDDLETLTWLAPCRSDLSRRHL